MPRFAGLVVSIVFLVQTASVQARRRGGCTQGPSASCTSYHCDFGWDVTMAVLWTCMLAGSLLDSPFSLSALVVNALLAEMFITTAVLSGLVRRRLGSQALPDVEMAAAQQVVTAKPTSVGARPAGGALEPL